MYNRSAILIISWLCFCPTWVIAQLHLANMFSDSMILQRDRPVAIWGKAVPTTKINLQIGEKSYHTRTNSDSTWKIIIHPIKAGGPYDIIVKSSSAEKKLKDVYFGDVWLCSGQSNMAFRLGSAGNASTEIPAATFPLIRQFEVAPAISERPLKELVKGKWLVCNPDNAASFSAVAYFFAKEIFQQTHVPIGIINSTWGGTDILAWMDAAQVSEFGAAKKMIDTLYPGFIQHEKERRKEILQRYEKRFFAGISNPGVARDIDFFDGQGWQECDVPGTLQSQHLPIKKGYVWLRKNIILPPAFASHDATIELDRLREAEATFINGVRVGYTIVGGYTRGYVIPEGLLRAGNNEILICCHSESNEVGFSGVYLPKFVIKNSVDTVVIQGRWQYKQGPQTNFGPIEPMDFERKYPSLIYNAMIAPLFRLQLKGILWYQGEQNANQVQCWDYGRMLVNLITSWRAAFGQNKLPFYLVQLPNFGKLETVPKPAPWAVLREQQDSVASAIANVDMVTTIDIGNPLDVHPTGKKEVGRRLALLAESKVYHEKHLVISGPVFKSVRYQNNRAIISFKNIAGGLMTTNKADMLNAFAVAGEDGIYYRALARIAGNKVIVSSDKVPHPKAVRYAFEASPPKVNLYNSAGLPAVPFRTDKGRIKI